ncbi:MAG: VWA domain-containing protein [Spirochaetales bacterium]
MPAFSQPVFLLAVFAVIPALIFNFIKLKKIKTLFQIFSAPKNSAAKTSVYARTVFRIISWTLAWICAVIALAGPSWGTQLIPLQRSGNAVAFVFDISHSMTAQDVFKENTTLTRLEAVKEFSYELLSRINGSSVSAILTKGDGILALPLTEDYYAMFDLINALSPGMLSSPGSSLASGITEATESFPPQSARHSYIVVCTDGDETDNALEAATQKATEYGIQVIFVGFGSQNGAEIIAGDGITQVHTSLKAEKLSETAQKNNVTYIPASQDTAINTIIDIINPSIFLQTGNAVGTENTAYEVQPVERHIFFMTLALFFFLAGFCRYFFRLKNLFSFFSATKSQIPMILCIFFTVHLFTGCSQQAQEARRVLEGSYYWSQQNYQKSIAALLDVTQTAQESDNFELLQYGLFGLSAGYLMQGEIDAALTKINDMGENITPSLDFARLYNQGIIFHRQGEYKLAAKSFKQALVIDASNISAKINLELCIQEETAQSQKTQQELIPAGVEANTGGADDAVFSFIRENEENRWKNQQVSPQQSDVIDY